MAIIAIRVGGRPETAPLWDALCGALGLPTEKVQGVDGGRGMKTGLYLEDIVAAHAARILNRPMRWTAERIEEFLAARQGRDVESPAELARSTSTAPDAVDALTRVARGEAALRQQMPLTSAKGMTAAPRNVAGEKYRRYWGGAKRRSTSEAA
jgi:CO/xanthine dehydrogenase Mo-binding subunit